MGSRPGQTLSTFFPVVDLEVDGRHVRYKDQKGAASGGGVGQDLHWAQLECSIYSVIAAALSNPMAMEIAARKIPDAVFPSSTCDDSCGRTRRVTP